MAFLTPSLHSPVHSCTLKQEQRLMHLQAIVHSTTHRVKAPTHPADVLITSTVRSTSPAGLPVLLPSNKGGRGQILVLPEEQLPTNAERLSPTGSSGLAFLHATNGSCTRSASLLFQRAQSSSPQAPSRQPSACLTSCPSFGTALRKAG